MRSFFFIARQCSMAANAIRALFSSRAHSAGELASAIRLKSEATIDLARSAVRPARPDVAGFVLFMAFVLLSSSRARRFSRRSRPRSFRCSHFHIERLKARRADFAAALARLMENPRRLLSAILLRMRW